MKFFKKLNLSMNFIIVLICVTFTLIEIVWLQYAGCDYFQELNSEDVYLISSPNSQIFLQSVECRWAAEAPPEHTLHLDCNEVRLQPTPSCYGDRILVSRSGRSDLRDAKRYCGGASFSETSTSTKITIALKIGLFSAGGKFKCSLKAVASNCSCGQTNKGRIGEFHLKCHIAIAINLCS